MMIQSKLAGNKVEGRINMYPVSLICHCQQHFTTYCCNINKTIKRELFTQNNCIA